MLLFCPSPTALFLYGNILFLFLLVHNCTWCCTTLHTLQYSVFTSFLPSFSIFPAPSVPSLHFKNLMSSRSFASQYCFWYRYSFTDFYPSRTICSQASISYSEISRSRGCRITISPMRKGDGDLSDNVFRSSTSSSVNLFSMLQKKKKKKPKKLTVLLFLLYFQKHVFPSITPHQQKTPWSSACPSSTHSLSTPYHRSFNNLFIIIYFILLFILCFVLF